MKDFDVEDAQIAAVQLCSDAVADRFHRICEWLTIVNCRNLEVVADCYLMMSIDILQKERWNYTKNVSRAQEEE